MSAVGSLGIGSGGAAWESFMQRNNARVLNAENTNTKPSYQLRSPQDIMERSKTGESDTYFLTDHRNYNSSNPYTLSDAQNAKKFFEECKASFERNGFTLVDTESDEQIGTDLFWHSVANEVNSVWQPYAAPNLYFGEETYTNLGDAIESLSSRYAAIQNRLEGKFSGEALDGQMAKLQSTFSRAIDRLGDDVEALFGRTIGNGDKFRSSAIDAFWNQADQYLQFSRKNPDYSNLRGKDEELKKDTRLMATLLREQYRKEGKLGVKSSDAFSLQALRAASDLSKVWDGPSPYLNCGIDGASYGLVMGYQTVQAEHILQKYGVEKELGSLVSAKLEQDFQTAMDKAEKSANAIRIPQDYITIDRESAKLMLDQFIRNWSKSGGDMKETLRKSGSALVAGKQLSQLSPFGRNFFSVNQSSQFDRYYKSPYIDKLMKNWQWVESGLPKNS